MSLRVFPTLAAALLATTFLTGCKTADQKAEDYYLSAMELAAEGDAERALVELRNVFKLDEDHEAARAAYARIELERGNVQQAYSQYLRLVEQHPDNLEGLRELARMALDANSWDEVERVVRLAEEAQLIEADPVLKAISVNLEYRSALLSNAKPQREAAAAKALALIDQEASTSIARRVVIDNFIRREDWAAALTATEQGIEHNPQDRQLYLIRLGLFEKLGRSAEIEAQLKDMIGLFPDDAAPTQMLISMLMSQGRTDDAEGFLRQQIDPADEGYSGQMQVVSFLLALKGPEAAITELDALISAGGPNVPFYRSSRGSLKFDTGSRDEGIAELEDVVGAVEDTEDGRRIKVALARMYQTIGNDDGAKRLVGEVLSSDPTEVEALKIRATWLIDEDNPGDALVDLRSALDQSPLDPKIMTLMAQAHDRAGNSELVPDMLSRAVEASKNAPDYSLRYAEYLAGKNQLLPAEDVLKDTLKVDNDNVQVLRALGLVYVRLVDRPRLQTVIGSLNRIGSEAARSVANDLTARMLAAQDRRDELNAFLESLAQSGEGGLQAEIAIIQSRLAAGETDAALAYTQDLIARSGATPQLRYVEGGVLAATGKFDEAEAAFRDILDEIPGSTAVVMALSNLMAIQGDRDAALAIIEEGLAVNAENGALLFAKAGSLERRGDYEGAIAIYEKLYAANSASVVVANNLASMITTYRDSREDLERAYAVARRLRNTQVPAFQDTYGWIAARLGNFDEALGYLEGAASALPSEPLVQFHLAETYAGLGRKAEAVEAYQKVLDLQEDGASPEYLERVNAEMARLNAEIGAEAATEAAPEASQ
jgi:tetratricopeptide (TPR) repeat protein